MKHIEDYCPECRFYTGLYSTTASAFIKQVLSRWYWKYYVADVARTPDKEVVVVSGRRIFIDNKIEDTSPENLKRVLCNCLSLEMTDTVSPEPRRKTARAVLEYLTRSEDADEECAKIIARLKGKRADPVSAEIANCVEQETKRIEDEHGTFATELKTSRSYSSVAAMFGNYGCPPCRASAGKDLEFEHIDQTELAELNRLRQEMRDVNNALCEAIQRYDRAYQAYQDKLRGVKSLNTKTRNDRVKAVKAEFKAVKHASAGGNA